MRFRAELESNGKTAAGFEVPEGPVPPGSKHRTTRSGRHRSRAGPRRRRGTRHHAPRDRGARRPRRRVGRRRPGQEVLGHAVLQQAVVARPPGDQRQEGRDASSPGRQIGHHAPRRPGPLTSATTSRPTRPTAARTSRAVRQRHRTNPLTRDRDHVPGVQLRSPSRLDLPVHLHLLGLDELARVRPVLGDAGQLEELTQPNRQLGNGHVLDRCS